MPIDEVNELLERRAARGRLGHRRRARFNLLGHVPAEGETVEFDGLPAPGRAGAGPAHQPGADRRRVPRLDAERRAATERRGRRAASVVRSPASSPSSGGPTSASRRCSTAILGRRSAIVSDKPQTTRTAGARRARPARRPGRVRRHARHPQAPHAARRAAQRHRPPRALGDVDVVVPRGRRHRAARPGRPVRRRAGARRRRASSSTRSTSRRPSEVARPAGRRRAELDLAEYFPVSARTGDGVAELVEALVARLPEGPPYYPDDMVTDVPEAFWVAELVREQLLAVTREELPHSIATRVTEWEWPRIRVRDPRRARLARRGS